MTLYPSDSEIEVVFDYIEDHCREYDGSTIDYRSNNNNVEKLKGVIERSKNDDYYPTIYDKAAYIFSAVIEGHYFENGNKRLAVYITFLLFVLNKYALIMTLTSARKKKIQALIARIMRNITKDELIKIEQQGYIYALAIYIAKGNRKFNDCKKDAYTLFSNLITAVT